MLYNLNKPFKFHVELTDKCNAMCPLCERTVFDKNNELKLNPLVCKQEISFARWKEIFNDWNKQIDEMFFCGNYGDPIAASEFLEIVDHTKNILQAKSITAHTNGGLRNTQWWKKLANILKNYNHYIEFGIDGSDQETHSTYRVNTNLKKVLENAKTFIDEGGTAMWKMVIFKHNQHQVEECEKISKEMGFKKFLPEVSARTEHGQTVTYKFKDVNKTLERSTLYKHHSEKNKTYKNFKIDCYAKSNNSIFIAADSKIHPCCYLAPKRVKNDHQSLEKRNIEAPSKNKSLLACAVNRWTCKDLPNSFNKNPHPICVHACGKKLGQDLKNHNAHLINNHNLKK